MNKKDLNKEFIQACYKQDFNKIKLSLQNGADINVDKDAALIFTSKMQNLECVNYLLTSPELNKKSNITARNYAVLRGAVLLNHQKTLEYFLNHLKDNSSKEFVRQTNLAFQRSLKFKHTNLVKFLLETPDLKKHINIHAVKKNEGNPQIWNLIEHHKNLVE